MDDEHEMTFDGFWWEDRGLDERPCPCCGAQTVHHACERDEKSNGAIFAYAVVICTTCLWDAPDREGWWNADPDED